jgi:translation initiation factor 3 subunit L
MRCVVSFVWHVYVDREADPHALALQNMIHIAESTVGRRYAGWFIRNSEHAARVLDSVRALPLPVATAAGGSRPQGRDSESKGEKNAKADGAPRTGGQKVAWGGVKAA